ncbi:Protein of unknown function [Granulicella rosea]|uniref:DUF2809 domain-containing protein n=1 Tax=Granulicella rosea TaxID=474952 RepID=A0A239DIY6_9BACT|nr:DUF2809 domain-containing protein [Granulicella rosea]SNS32400.1 Protein of unknown function [Granulicella rosea]
MTQPERCQAGRRTACTGFAALALVAGLIWRLAPLHLPFFWYKWGGSFLWAVMVYWITAALLPRLSPWKIALWAGVAATGIECIRLFHTPGLDAFRYKLAGKLLLGRVFSGWDIAVYWVGILLAALADRWDVR